MSRQHDYDHLPSDTGYDGGAYLDPMQSPPFVQNVGKKTQVNSVEMRSIHSESPEISYSDGPDQRQPEKRGNGIAQSYPGHKWTPGVWHAFPHRGVWALFGCMTAIIAAIIIVVKSHDQPANWVVSPSVYLAIFMTITNMLARFAFHDGVKITWWRKALNGGTVNDLHARWSHADGFWAALFAGRSFNFISLASLAVTFIAIDQPLIQRASGIRTVRRTAPVNVTAPIAPEIPWGFTGYQNGRGTYQQIMTQPMIWALNDFNSETGPYLTDFVGCDDTCTGFVDAGGLAAQCNSTTGPITYLQNMYAGQTESPFSVDFSMDTESIDSPPQIIVNIAYSRYVNRSDITCAAIRTERTCRLTSATLRYPVTLNTRNQITVGDVLGQGQVQSFQPPNPDGEAEGDYSRYTLGGLFLAAQTLFTSNATYTFGGGIGYFMSLPDTLSSQFIDLPQLNLTGMTSLYNLTVPEACQSSWTDPTSHILSSLNTMAFMLSVTASQFPFRNTTAAPKPQMLVMDQTSTVNIYHADWRYLIASVVITFAMVLFIIPTFAGWWEVGRSVTLSPLETAKAFDAPLLRGPGSNAPLRSLIQVVGARRVKWGEIHEHEQGHSGVEGSLSSSRLVMADPDEVVHPRKGKIYL